MQRLPLQRFLAYPMMGGLWSVSIFFLQSPTSLAQSEIDYRVVEPQGYSFGRFHGSTVFDGRQRGDYDPERIEAIGYANKDLDYAVAIVMPDTSTSSALVGNMRDEERPEVHLFGEDRVFAEIENDIREQACFSRGNSTDCDLDEGFEQTQLGFISDSGRSVNREILQSSNFYRALENLTEEPSLEERFQMLNDSFNIEMNESLFE